MKTRMTLLALVLATGTSYAQSTDQNAGQKSSTTPTDVSQPRQQKPKQTSNTSTTNQPSATNQNTSANNQNSSDPAAVMKLTQQAMAHIDAAARALQAGNKAEARTALAQSKQTLDKLYKTPPVAAMLNELDEAINSMSGKGPGFKPVDLEPLRARISTFSEYVEPQVFANIDEAQRRAKQGDQQGSQNALKLARERVAIDLAFLPVEEAYSRVLAAQQALETGDTKTALAMLRNVPIVMTELQLSRPLLPIRAELQAAAVAADAKQWDRTRSLLDDASQKAQNLTASAPNSDLANQLKPIANDIQRLSRQAQAGTNVRPDDIRDVARRAKNLGGEASQANQPNQNNQG